MAHSYSHLYNLPTTGLRFFTVYGPWGRPDMAPMLFADAILNNRPIKVFNHGQMKRDFTYIDDIVEGVVRTAVKPAAPNTDFDALAPESGSSKAPFRVFNIGNGQPVNLMDFINALEEVQGRTVKKVFLEMQPGDVTETFADTKRLRDWVGYRPETDIHTGVRAFVDWHQSYYGNKS
jgi:UDP-glucuronate 4-epimerase